jgi:hypothetical protein
VATKETEMKTKTYTAYAERVQHLAACRGADATDRALTMCFEARVPQLLAAALIGNMANGYSGEAGYQYLASKIAKVQA